MSQHRLREPYQSDSENGDRKDNSRAFHCSGTAVFNAVPRTATSTDFAFGATSNTNAFPFFDTSEAPGVASTFGSFTLATKMTKRLRALALGMNVESPIVNGYGPAASCDVPFTSTQRDVSSKKSGRDIAISFRCGT